MTYQPRPLDLNDIPLPEALRPLVERLAENNHDVWAAQRLAEGWRYGPARNDPTKEHPCLVPYADLPESEKEYDRLSAMATIKAILALGFQLATPHEAGSEPVNLEEALEERQRLKVWYQEDDLEHYRSLGDQILKLGEPLMAYDLMVEGLQRWPGDARLRQLLALALLRSGSTKRAEAVLLELRREGHADEETLGLCARGCKDLADQAVTPAEKQQYWRQARDQYEASFRSTGGYWTGINAATMAALLGDWDQATKLAAAVKDLCLAKLASPGAAGDQYWLEATVAEAALLQGDLAGAEEWYCRAALTAGNHFGDLASTRRNARYLMAARNLDEHQRALLERSFNLPRVVIFAGHMLDRPGPGSPRFPAAREADVKAVIRERLLVLDGRLGYGSAACGADILFLEAVLELGGGIHLVLPCKQEEFCREFVDLVPGGNWRERFERLLSRAKSVNLSSDSTQGRAGVYYDYTRRLLFGLAKIRAEQLGADLVPLAVWDGRPGSGVSGTAEAVKFWQSLGYEVQIIPLPVGAAVPAPVRGEIETLAPTSEEEGDLRVCSILFADAVGFSRLTDAQVPVFVEEFLGAVAKLVAAGPYQPLAQKTWGDGLYFVFGTARDAGRFALDLCDLVNTMDWGERGLPEDLNLRIALHAGPVSRLTDPLSGKSGYFGAHVNRAARIEPITPPGTVYISQSFAALAAAEHVAEFTFDYVGLTSLAKDYGTLPMYHLRRSGYGSAG
jgi:class 3 adenylate cyclase